MSESDPPPYRGLSTTFLDALDALAGDEQGGWWRDVLAHPDLILAVRREALDVYYRGASLFRIVLKGGRPVPRTHVKYLVRQRQAHAELDAAGSFRFEAKAVLWHDYAGPQTLAEMIKAAGSLVGAEKTGVHALVQASANVVDVEIALAGDDSGDLDAQASEGVSGTSVDPGAAERGRRQDRIDVASLEERGHPSEAWLVFHEAKDYTNGGLRAAAKRTPAIVAQMGRYRGSIGQNHGALVYSYPFVCRALVRLDRLRRTVRADHPDRANRMQLPLDPLIAAVADGTRRLRIEVVPRLVVFGYDGAQKAVWEAERTRLQTQFGLRIYAIGDPAAAKVAAAFRRPLDEPLSPPAAPEAPPLEQIPLPQDAPAKLCLYFGSGGLLQPVYLCNPSDTALTDVEVTSLGVTSNHPEVVHTGSARTTVPEVPARTGVLIDRYDVMTDGDRLTPYTIVAVRPDGTRLRATAIIGKGGPSGRFVPLDLAEVPASRDRSVLPPAASS